MICSSLTSPLHAQVIRAGISLYVINVVKLSEEFKCCVDFVRIQKLKHYVLPMQGTILCNTVPCSFLLNLLTKQCISFYKSVHYP